MKELDAAAPLVSVLVPTRNSSKYLRECLDSIKRQTYQNVEVIVVDNSSTDDTRKVALEYGAHVELWGNERSAQVNRGAAVARGTYVFRVDSDFYLAKTVIEECITEALRGADAIVVHNSPKVIGRLSAVRKFEVDCYKNSLSHSAARFISRELYLRVGGYDERIIAGEDYDFQNRLSRAGARIGFCQSEATHLGEPESLLDVMRKFYVYGKDFPNYLSANPADARRQLAFVRRDFLCNWRRLLAHPGLSVMMVSYHSLKYAVGATGLSVRIIQDIRSQKERRSRNDVEELRRQAIPGWVTPSRRLTDIHGEAFQSEASAAQAQIAQIRENSPGAID